MQHNMDSSLNLLDMRHDVNLDSISDRKIKYTTGDIGVIRGNLSQTPRPIWKGYDGSTFDETGYVEMDPLRVHGQFNIGS